LVAAWLLKNQHLFTLRRKRNEEGVEEGMPEVVYVPPEETDPAEPARRPAHEDARRPGGEGGGGEGSE
jgi:hypothetical protein